jgi:predicted phage baseplate assembly protein
VFSDYDGDGATIRFGDGTFGRPPVPGTTFRARYLAGGGDAGNVAADTIGTVLPGDTATNLVWRCTNPFPATGGADPETHAQIRDRVPHQVASSLLSLTGPADYQQAALSFSAPGSGGAAWARQAIAAVRWTGSWLSTLTIADPAVDEARRTQRAALAGLDRVLSVRRLTGADTAVALVRYCWLDLRIVCVASAGSHPGDVVGAVIAELSPLPDANGATGFFGRDKWTFGQPLEASALIAAIQSCPGVVGVTSIHYRRTPEPGAWRPLRATIGVAPSEILRIDNDRDRPGHGLLFVTAGVAR